MTRQVRVSAILIFLDAEPFIEEAIRSVLAQSFGGWELLLVDDGSTDGSAAIARRYAELHPGRIRYLCAPGNTNRGMSAARNLGLAAARGEYVAFIDADDVWLPSKLEHQVALLDRHPEAAMVYGPTLLWYSWTRRPEDQGRDRPRHLGTEPERLVRPPTLIPLFLRKHALPPATCGVLVRRTAAERVDGFVADFRGMYEDQAFFYKLCLHESVYVTEACLDLYRQHDRSASAQSEAIGFYDGNGPNAAHEIFLLWFRRYCEHAGALDAAVAAALDDALWPYRHPYLSRLHRGVRSRWDRVERLLGIR